MYLWSKRLIASLCSMVYFISCFFTINYFVEHLTFFIYPDSPPTPALKYTSSLSNFQKKSSIVHPPPSPQNDVSRPKAVPKPQVMARCSLLGQSCVPLCGCCDPCATCHCRFFNAICFCRRVEQARSRCGSKKTAKRRKAKKNSKTQP
uniref:Agouti domain-containing protein n=1 Tax=Poecilia mexicana TaxID=48701 RepID=A0A3B3WD72_9TELE